MLTELPKVEFKTSLAWVYSSCMFCFPAPSTDKWCFSWWRIMGSESLFLFVIFSTLIEVLPNLAFVVCARTTWLFLLLISIHAKVFMEVCWITAGLKTEKGIIQNLHSCSPVAKLLNLYAILKQRILLNWLPDQSLINKTIHCHKMSPNGFFLKLKLKLLNKHLDKGS